MSKELYEDKVDKQQVDSKLVRRLLAYARPYWKFLLLAMVMMIFVTGLELLRPYLLKVAIDDYITGYENPMYQMDINDDYQGTVYDGKEYVRLDTLEDEEKEALKSYPVYNIMKENKDYYLGSEDSSLSDRVLLDQEAYALFRQRDISGINKISIFFLIAILLGFVFNYGQVVILNYTSQKIIFNIRQELYGHIQNLSISYFDKNPIGRLVTRVSNDTENLNEMYTSVVINLFKDVFVLIGIMFIMLSMNVKLALISLGFLPLVIVASIIFRKKIRVVYRIARAQVAKINSKLNENITGMRTIQIFEKQEKIADQFDEINKDYLETTQRQIKIFAIFRPSMEVIRSLGIATVVYYAGGDVISGVIEFGVLYAFIEYLQKFFQPILDLTEKYNIMQSAMASSERIFKILDEDDFIENKEDALRVKELRGKIEFKNVWFAYVDEDWVLKDISFTINPGEAIAFVGATGAGKSSIINLITRFYDIQKGEILIDGVNVKEYNKDDLRRRIGVVLQDVFIFTGTIADNIKLNNKDISHERLVEVAEYVNADYFINRLPNKYQEEVMERGSTLSSGERQLLAFARTLAYNPDILILDEATSNIDTDTELLIQDALGKLIQNRTTIAVAHRLSTIQHADKIIVLHRGEIKEMGNHQELLNREGMYYDLYRLQYQEAFDADQKS